MTDQRIGIEDVKPQLLDRLDDLILALIPDARINNQASVRVRNPVTQDSDANLAIYRRGRSPGAWKDFSTEEKGDVLDLIAYVNQVDRKGALSWAKDWLGLERMTREEKLQAKEDAAKRRAENEAAAAEAERKRLARVRQLWDKVDPLFSDTPADRHARAYMAARNCAFEDVPHLDRQTFGTLPAQEYWELAEWKMVEGKRKKVRNGPDLPCLVSAFRAPTGQVMALHFTFLHPTEPRKADLPQGKNAKLMFGVATGAVLRIAHGPDEREVPHDPHPLLLLEGIEDGLSMAQIVPSHRVWVAGSLHHLGTVVVDWPFVSNVIIGADNDTPGGTAQEQFKVAQKAIERQGKRVSVTRPATGFKDFNDWLREDDDDGPEDHT